jgi:hypothetical protein
MLPYHLLRNAISVPIAVGLLIWCGVTRCCAVGVEDRTGKTAGSRPRTRRPAVARTASSRKSARTRKRPL